MPTQYLVEGEVLDTVQSTYMQNTSPPSPDAIGPCGMWVLWLKTACCRTLVINSYLVYFSRMGLKCFELNALDLVIINYTVNFHQSGYACVFALSRH